MKGTKLMAGVEEIKSVFVRSLRSSDARTDPYRHWLLEQALPESVVDDLMALPIAAPRMDYSYGTRASNNALRGYFGTERQQEYPLCSNLAQAMQSPEVISAIEETCNVDLDGTFLRIEYTQDSPGFWLEPHTDIGVKRFTMLIYLSRDEDARNWGTSIYRDADTHFGEAPYEANHGMIFIPGSDTWHGYEKRPMSGIRKNLIVNFVGDEWRSTHELAFPDQPIQKAS